ncbi:molybdenum cofactor biosynthesis protein MoaE [Parapedobacter koreensis]|uniref:Molybdopterin synthase catalytic subunit n=1 Tax=Parapedobacter koreensis TaxID=332977 RepID=A0A1H7MS61_9SPHI|nr:molybdenum cofactor biosynthesis protein MoaE [Parapedobacter koreensis]SEL13447.1 molybdopterin synthase catalytic subunit [Parapedobacter koreensis]
METTMQTIFIQGAISTTMVAQSIQRYATDMAIGAHSCFIGQVRADLVEGKEVVAIEYTAYQAMADEQLQILAADIYKRYTLNGIIVKHSLGMVAAGEICLLVLAVAGHRRAAMDACGELVDRIKNELPIWGKEYFAGDGYQWKINQ